MTGAMSTKNPLWNRNAVEAEISGSEGRRCLPGIKKIEFVEKTKWLRDS